MWWMFVRGALAASWYADVDGDGYGDAADTVEADTAPGGYVADDSDCNDADAAVSPSEIDSCDGVDNDCSGSADDEGDCPCEVEYFGTHTYLFCETGQTWAASEDLCQTVGYHLAGVNSAAENAWVDATADGYSTDKWWFGFNDLDREGTWQWIDGSTVSYSDWHSGEPNDSGGGEDCGQFNRYTDLTWNDEPCSYSLYSICEFASPINWYADADGDGFGNPSSSFYSSDQPAGYVEDASDCNDSAASVFPGGVGVCDGADQDCDGSIDDDLPLTTVYADADSDGYGDPAATLDACGPVAGYAAEGTDCDDTDWSVFPGAIEVVADERDGDCDGGEICFGDADVDGYGTGATVVSPDVDCSGRTESTTSDDCDDTAPLVNPGAADRDCDGFDDNCDGIVDDGLVPTSWWLDTDDDGYGDPLGGSFTACEQPEGRVLDFSDCDDRDADVFPGALEVCDGVDEDCDGVIDDGASEPFWYPDRDRDGQGDPAGAVKACAAPIGFVASGTDCDDADVAVFSGAPEVPADGIDQDCDGGDGCWRDGDADGYGSTTLIASPDVDCADGGESYNDLDCDDTTALVSPGIPEIDGDLRDNDCDGESDESQADDTDKDGLDDREEEAYGTDPMDPDTDDDGLSDGEEVLDYKTDPLDSDTDNGGVPDGEEVAGNTDPLDPSDDLEDVDTAEDPETGQDPDDTDPADTDPADTDDGDTDRVDTDRVDTDENLDGRAFGGGGCKCDSVGGLASGWLLLPLIALGWGRRRRL